MPNRNIVIVDDDPFFCDSVKTYFAKKDMRVIAVTDSEFAKLLDLTQVAIILLDIDMPGISGVELLKDIRKSYRPVVIMVSGQGDEATRLMCLSGGADFFFTKPVSLEELSLVVARLLGRTSDQDKSNTWVLSQSECCLLTPDSRTIGLSATEYRILEVLFARSPDVVPKEELVYQLNSAEADPMRFLRGLEVMLSRLRTRSSSFAFKLPIKALRNVGYVFHGTGIVRM
jgi:two-component system, OmpR family, response regulator